MKATIKSVFVANREKVEFVSDLYWYDTDNKKMLTFKGGKLKFDYTNNTNKNKIKAWFDKNKEEFELEMLNERRGSMTIGFPENVEKDIEDSLGYDKFDKNMFTIKDGEIKFEYNDIVSVEPIHVTTTNYTKNLSKIKEWFNKNKNKFELEALGEESGSLTVVFPEEFEEDIKDSLEYDRFDYEVSE